MTLAGRLKDSFVAGVLLVAPLVVTLFVLKLAVAWSLGVVDPVVQGTRLTRYTANERVVAQVLAAVAILAAVTLLGFLVQRPAVRRVFGGFGRVVTLIPLVNVVYSSVRQVASSLVDRDSQYESVVLVEHPRMGIYSIGLVTAESPTAVGSVVDGESHTVFLPNSPNPTGGRLVVVPADQIHEIDLTVREGMRLIVTTGMGTDAEDLATARLGAPGIEG